MAHLECVADEEDQEDEGQEENRRSTEEQARGGDRELAEKNEQDPVEVVRLKLVVNHVVALAEVITVWVGGTRLASVARAEDLIFLDLLDVVEEDEGDESGVAH